MVSSKSKNRRFNFYFRFIWFNCSWFIWLFIYFLKMILEKIYDEIVKNIFCFRLFIFCVDASLINSSKLAVYIGNCWIYTCCKRIWKPARLCKWFLQCHCFMAKFCGSRCWNGIYSYVERICYWRHCYC